MLCEPYHNQNDRFCWQTSLLCTLVELARGGFVAVAVGVAVAVAVVLNMLAVKYVQYVLALYLQYTPCLRLSIYP